MSGACIFCFMLRDDHSESVLSSMQTIMVVLLEESEDVREDLLSILLSTLGHEKKVSISYINFFFCSRQIANALTAPILFKKHDFVKF